MGLIDPRRYLPSKSFSEDYAKPPKRPLCKAGLAPGRTLARNGSADLLPLRLRAAFLASQEARLPPSSEWFSRSADERAICRARSFSRRAPSWRPAA